MDGRGMYPASIYRRSWRWRATYSAISTTIQFNHPNSTFGILFPAQKVFSSSQLSNWSPSLTNRTGGVALVGTYNGLLVLSSSFRLPALARGLVFQSVLSFECGSLPAICLINGFLLSVSVFVFTFTVLIVLSNTFVVPRQPQNR